MPVGRRKRRFGDGGGLLLSASSNGGLRWTFQYVLRGKQTGLGLGSVRDVTLADARDLAAQYRSQLKKGADPKAARSSAVTFDECAIAYLRDKSKGWKSTKHHDQWRATIAMYASPTIGALPVADINTETILRVLQPIWLTRTVTAKRLRGRIEAILDWAKVKGYRGGENPCRWKGHLQHTLAPPKTIHKTAHHP